jgi:hypothetical protein
MGENVCQLYICKGLIPRIYREPKKLSPPKSIPYEEMGK